MRRIQQFSNFNKICFVAIPFRDMQPKPQIVVNLCLLVSPNEVDFAELIVHQYTYLNWNKAVRPIKLESI